MGRMYAWQNSTWKDIGSSGVIEDVYLEATVPKGVVAPRPPVKTPPKGANVTVPNTVLPVGPVEEKLEWWKVAVVAGVLVGAFAAFKLVVAPKVGAMHGLSRRHRRARR